MLLEEKLQELLEEKRLNQTSNFRKKTLNYLNETSPFSLYAKLYEIKDIKSGTILNKIFPKMFYDGDFCKILKQEVKIKNKKNLKYLTKEFISFLKDTKVLDKEGILENILLHNKILHVEKEDNFMRPNPIIFYNLDFQVSFNFLLDCVNITGESFSGEQICKWVSAICLSENNVNTRNLITNFIYNNEEGFEDKKRLESLINLLTLESFSPTDNELEILKYCLNKNNIEDINSFEGHVIDRQIIFLNNIKKIDLEEERFKNIVSKIPFGKIMLDEKNVKSNKRLLDLLMLNGFDINKFSISEGGKIFVWYSNTCSNVFYENLNIDFLKYAIDKGLNILQTVNIEGEEVKIIDNIKTSFMKTTKENFFKELIVYSNFKKVNEEKESLKKSLNEENVIIHSNVNKKRI